MLAVKQHLCHRRPQPAERPRHPGWWSRWLLISFYHCMSRTLRAQRFWDAVEKERIRELLTKLLAFSGPAHLPWSNETRQSESVVPRIQARWLTVS